MRAERGDFEALVEEDRGPSAGFDRQRAALIQELEPKRTPRVPGEQPGSNAWESATTSSVTARHRPDSGSGRQGRCRRARLMGNGDEKPDLGDAASIRADACAGTAPR